MKRVRKYKGERVFRLEITESILRKSISDSIKLHLEPAQDLPVTCAISCAFRAAGFGAPYVDYDSASLTYGWRALSVPMSAAAVAYAQRFDHYIDDRSHELMSGSRVVKKQRPKPATLTFTFPAAAKR